MKTNNILLKGHSVLEAPELEGSSKKKNSDLQDINEKGKTHMRDFTKPVGDACREDGTLKDASELEWPDSPTELAAPQNYWNEHDYEPAQHPEGDFDRRSSTPPEGMTVESEDELTIPQKRTKVSIGVAFDQNGTHNLTSTINPHARPKGRRKIPLAQ